MKKKFAAILTIILFVVLCVALSACSVDIEHTHTFSADDGDCTTADTCTVCQLVLTAKVHAPSANWSKDATNHWKECANEGCTKLAVEKTNHTPNADDSNCTTAITCSECSEVTTEAKEHSPSANWNTDESQHWKGCVNLGCTTALGEKINHTPNADDSDCTTAIICSACNEVTTATKVHALSENYNKDETSHWNTCTNEGCTKLAVVMANHTMKNGSNACECGYVIDVSIFTIANGNLTECRPGAYTSITIPDSVTSIGYNAFYGCSSLASIEIPNSVTKIGHAAFYNCSSLASITIGNSVTSIGDGAFYNCSGLTSIEIPNSVTSIEIPNSVTSIGDHAFYGCSSLASITYNGTIAQWQAIAKGSIWNSYSGNYTVTCTNGTLTKEQS